MNQSEQNRRGLSVRSRYLVVVYVPFLLIGAGARLKQFPLKYLPSSTSNFEQHHLKHLLQYTL